MYSFTQLNITGCNDFLFVSIQLNYETRNDTIVKAFVVVLAELIIGKSSKPYLESFISRIVKVF